MKTAFKREIDRLNKDNALLRSQIRQKDVELKHLRMSLKEAEARYQSLQEYHEQYLFNYSEKIEAAEEARIIYESRAETLRQLIKEYTKEADQWISAIKSQRKAV